MRNINILLSQIDSNIQSPGNKLGIEIMPGSPN